MFYSKITSKTFFLFLFMVALGGGFLFLNFNSSIPSASTQKTQHDEQESTVRAIENTMPAVVNITVYQTQPVTHIELGADGEKEQTEKEEKVEKGAGTGFIMSQDGYIITNKHVVATDKPDKTQYRVLLSSGKKYYAQLIDKDPLHDLAVLKIYDKDLPFVDIGNSEDLKVGGTVMAIGNALGEYQNTVTKGIISGKGRSLRASGPAGDTKNLTNVLQTDAEINLGNSGGPLVNLDGEVVGGNVAVDQRGSDIGFAIPIDDVKPVIDSIRKTGTIIRPQLGVRYIMLTPQIAREKEVGREWGALVTKGEDGESAVMQGSAADKAGLKAGDVIFEIDAVKIKGDNTLRSLVQRYDPGDMMGMKVQRGEKVFIRKVRLQRFQKR